MQAVRSTCLPLLALKAPLSGTVSAVILREGGTQVPGQRSGYPALPLVPRLAACRVALGLLGLRARMGCPCCSGCHEMSHGGSG